MDNFTPMAATNEQSMHMGGAATPQSGAGPAPRKPLFPPLSLTRNPNGYYEYRYKICLIGNGGTGKTTYVNKVLNGVFERKYVATIGASVRSVQFYLNDGMTSIIFEVWDTAGQEKHKGLLDGYYIDAIGAFFFFDVNSRETCSAISRHVEVFSKACYQGASPVNIICGNKQDTVETERWPRVHATVSRLLRDLNTDIIYISAKTNYNFDKPFQTMARRIFGDMNIELSANLDMTPLPMDYDFFGAVENVADVSGAAVDFMPREHAGDSSTKGSDATGGMKDMNGNYL